MPISFAAASRRASASIPSISTEPASAPTRPAMIERSVVLPAPLRPRSATIWPASTSRSTPRTACTSPYDFSTPFATSTRPSWASIACRAINFCSHDQLHRSERPELAASGQGRRDRPSAQRPDPGGGRSRSSRLGGWQPDTTPMGSPGRRLDGGTPATSRASIRRIAAIGSGRGPQHPSIVHMFDPVLPGDPRNRAYFGGMRMPPSTRIVSAFMYGLVIRSITMNASSSELPSRLGNKTDWPRWALNWSDCSPEP